ncbi:MAG: OmpA family protein [Cyclobacteriaceae bacterium]
MKYLFVFVLGFWSTTQETMSYAQPKDVVYLNGKILDADSKEPVEAKLKYQLLPISNVMGIRFFDNQDGHYHIYLQQHREYTLQVTAENYQPLQLTLQTDDPGELPKNLLLRRLPQKGDYLHLSDTIWFDRDLSTIRPETHSTIQELKDLLDHYPKMVIQLEGHTDRGGQSLLELSEERAENVKDYLVGLGIRKKRIKTKAYGNSHLMSREDSIEGRQKNRRVEIKVLDI